MNAVSANIHTSHSETAMPEAERNALLLGSLRRLVRALSALFWGLPLTLLLAVQTGKGDWFKPLGFVPVSCAMAMLFYGTILLSKFQSQERVWRNAIERARLVALVNLGLSPFLLFWSKVPGQAFFNIMVTALSFGLLAFLFLLNTVLARLAAMLPDETLRGETKVFTRLNQIIILTLIGTLPFWFILHRVETLPRLLVKAMLLMQRGGVMMELLLIMFFILLPIAMTMALLWKTKEVIMTGVFSTKGNDLPPATDGQ
jgi:hypothetical protein